MMVIALDETFVNKKWVYGSVVSQNEITYVLKILDIFRTVRPFSRVQIYSGPNNTVLLVLLRIDWLSKNIDYNTGLHWQTNIYVT